MEIIVTQRHAKSGKLKVKNKMLLLEKYKIRETVKMILEEDQIVIRPSIKPRQGWSEAFEAMNANGDDKLLIEDVFDDETGMFE